MRVYASSITEEQRIASGAASVAGTDREGFDEVKGLQGLHGCDRSIPKPYAASCSC